MKKITRYKGYVFIFIKYKLSFQNDNNYSVCKGVPVLVNLFPLEI